MKIVQFTDEVWDSGLSEYALTLASALSDAGHESYFMARKNSHAALRAKTLNLKLLEFENKITDTLKALREIQPDIINAHTGSSHSCAVALTAFLKKTAAIRTRADAREFQLKPFSFLLWGRTNGFIAANSEILKQFRASKANRIPSALIMQAVARPQTPPTPAQGAKLGLVARLDPVKGHACAIRAMALIIKTHPDTKLLIAGEDKNVKAADLKELAKQAGISANVEFYGRLPDVPAFMDGCALGLIPSLGSEAVSRGALEWLSRGRPVIASNVGGLADFVADGETGFIVPPGDERALADAVLKLLGNAEIMRAFGEAGAAVYDKKFTPSVFARETEKFYREVLCTP
ncbi:MAG: glycosyltransferase family 4 protein [Elusimicrobiaceae bacterium]